jgi:hypothetical protein
VLAASGMAKLAGGEIQNTSVPLSRRDHEGGTNTADKPLKTKGMKSDGARAESNYRHADFSQRLSGVIDAVAVVKVSSLPRRPKAWLRFVKPLATPLWLPPQTMIHATRLVSVPIGSMVTETTSPTFR